MKNKEGGSDKKNYALEMWTELTKNGGEGMVVKPFGFISRGKKGLV